MGGGDEVRHPLKGNVGLNLYVLGYNMIKTYGYF